MREAPARRCLGELDPNAVRELPEGRKKLELEKVFAMMTGGGKKL